jgi:SAM-dependent methyltransferase
MLYDRAYYEGLRRAAESSAASVVPLVAGLASPRSVLDVGCGDGTWLDAYRRWGVADYFGVDGGDVREALRVPARHFAPRDLAAPLDLGRRFDLVQSLEVAEHLPPSAAETFADSLARHGDAVLFSAAIPHQGGTGHVNERWPDYWAELFARRGFAVYDWVRPRVWGDERVAWWYAQNALLFVRRGHPGEWLRRLPPPAPVGPLLRLVHPRQFQVAVARAAAPKPEPPPPRSVVAARGPSGPFDAAVVVPTVGRPTLERAVRSVFAQQFPGTIQVLVGVDAWGGGDRARLESLAAAAPPNCSVLVFDPGYSTSSRRGGFTPAGTGGALRTVLSYLAQSRLVAYLDDDNWWAPDHLDSLVGAVAGHDWAYSLRWYADGSGKPLCVDAWESVGPGAGAFAEKFGGFVDPSCLLIDRVACEPALRLWCHPLPEDASGMSTDRTVFAYLRGRRRGAGTGRATAFYTLSPSDTNHPVRMAWIARAAGAGAPRA